MQIIFEFDTPYGKFCDALYFEDGLVPSEAEIESIKQSRLDKWISVVTAPPAPVISKYKRDENNNLVLDANGDPIPLGA